MKWCVLLLAVCATADAELNDTWVRVGPAPAQERVSVRLELKRQNLDRLESKFWAVSDPHGDEYGKFLTATEVAELIAPGDAALARIAAWARSAPCPVSHSVVPTQDYVFVEMQAACAEALFAVSLHRWVHPRRRPLVRAASAVAIPSQLRADVDALFGLSELPLSSEMRVGRLGLAPKVGKEKGDRITPTRIATQYDMVDAMAGKVKSHGGSLALAEFEDSAFFPSDIQTFLSNFSLPSNNISKIVGTDDVFDGYLAEASLDVQYAMALAGPTIAAWAWSLGPFDLTAWALNVTATPNAPKVHSISYGSKETAYKAADMQRDTIEFQKMGVMGYTLLAASGDDGTGHSGFFRCKKFDPNFPATSPYVLAVGGTILTGASETAWISSGGGFSNIFGTPQYQAAAVSAYLSNEASSLPEASLFNKSGRAIPDVSAVSTNYQVLMQGFWDYEVSGTSAAAPVWAAVLALINNERLAKGKSTLGFVNPALYALGNGGVGHDIVDGANKAGGCKAGFNAAAGWDPVTGLGSPSLPALLKGLMAF